MENWSNVMEWWSIGPPWRDMSVMCCYRCNTLQTLTMQLKPSNTGLGQGVVDPDRFQYPRSFPPLQYSITLSEP